MSHQPASRQYLQTQIMTASPEALQLMLWDGAIRFAEQGRDAILKKDIEGSYKLLLRSQKIIMEMNVGLRHSLNPELCKKLAALYNFIYRRLVDANTKKDVAAVDDALAIMRHQRETWALLMDKLLKDRVAEAQATHDTAEENMQAGAALEAVSHAAAEIGAIAASASRPTLSPVRAMRPFYNGAAAAPARALSVSLSVEG